MSQTLALVIGCAVPAGLIMWFLAVLIRDGLLLVFLGCVLITAVFVSSGLLITYGVQGHL